MSSREDLEGLFAKLREERDDLRVRIHLAKAEIKDEWEVLERKLEHVESRLAAAGAEVKESAEDVGAALSQVAEEIGAAYKRIKRSLG
jgi:chromosome segregation ATPase